MPYSVSALTADSAGRVWFTDDAQSKIGLYDRRSHSVTELNLPRSGSVTSMVVDTTGALWAGTDAGELFAIRGETLLQSRSVGRPVLQLALDSQGKAWFLAGDEQQTRFGQATSPATMRIFPASVVGVWFDASSDAWLADRTSSGFYIAVPEAR